jgi:hypothetical protein
LEDKMENLLDQMVNQTRNANEVSRQVHVFYEGRAWDMDMDNLDVGMLSNDADIRNKVAEALNVPAVKLANFRVERNEATEDINLHPSAVFGFLS